MRPEKTRLPSYSAGILSVWRRSFAHFKKLWITNFFSIVLEPLLMLLAFGYGVGAFIPDIDGIAYADFFFPALLCISSMMVSFTEATQGNFSKLNSQRIYSTMIMTTLEPSQVVIGEALWAATKGSISAIAVAVIAGVFGHFDNLMLFPSFVVIFISSFLFASLGLAITSYVRSNEEFIFPMSVLIVPMSLFSGTYFPVDQLPFGVKYLTYLFPLSHSVSLVREFLLGGNIGWQTAIHLMVILVLTVVCLRIAIRRISKKLVS